MRPSFESIYTKLALNLAARSTCSRLQVGCVITTADYRQVLAIGYNGNAVGFPNKCDRDEPGNCGCSHSEINAAISCNAPRDQRKNVFVTTLPCSYCAKALINLGGVQKVFYVNDYRKRDSLTLLAQAGIEVRRLDENGTESES